MLDELAIQQTLNRYTEGASRRDWDQVFSTFAPGFVWDIPAAKQRFQDPEVIRQVMVAFVSPMEYFVQVNTPAIIRVDGDQATASSIIRECGKFADRDEALEILGRYEDRLTRTSDGWKFTQRTFHILGRHTFPLLPSRSP